MNCQKTGSLGVYKETVENSAVINRTIFDHDGICERFRCYVHTCIFFDCRGDYGDEECEGCMRCAICEHKRKCSEGTS